MEYASDFFSMCCKVLLLSFIISGCKAQKSPNVSGTLEGVIGIFEGNCMPGPDVEPCKPKPIATTIYVTNLSKNFEMDLLIDSTISADNGRYQLSLPAGEYSLFLRDGTEITCDQFECNPNCYCHPVYIRSDSTTIVDANLDHAAW